jgi:hypothetical protein
MARRKGAPTQAGLVADGRDRIGLIAAARERSFVARETAP